MIQIAYSAEVAATKDQGLPVVALESTIITHGMPCLLYTSPSPRDGATSRMPSSA